MPSSPLPILLRQGRPASSGYAITHLLPAPPITSTSPEWGPQSHSNDNNDVIIAGNRNSYSEPGAPKSMRKVILCLGGVDHRALQAPRPGPHTWRANPDFRCGSRDKRAFRELFSLCYLVCFSLVGFVLFCLRQGLVSHILIWDWTHSQRSP